MIYTNVKNIKEAKKLNINSMLTEIKKSDILYIDTETYAKDFNREDVIEAYISNHIAEKKKVTAATKKSAENHAQDIQKEKALDPYRSGVRLFQIATDKNNIFVIDTFVSSKKEIESIIKAISNKPIAGQNIKFELKVIKVNYPKFIPGEIFCTMIAYRMIKAYKEVGYSAAHLANVILYHTGVQLLKGHGGDDWSKLISEEQFNYAVEDVKYLKEAVHKQITELNSSSIQQVTKGYFNNLLFDTVSVIEMKFVIVVADAELEGIPVNRKELSKKQMEISKELFEHKKLFDKLKVNTSSPKQLLELLEKEIPDQDILSTSKNVLTRYAKYDIVNKLLKVKKLQKQYQMITDYINKWPVKGLIYPSFNQLRAPTGRMSCYDPNVQQIPRAFKKIFYLSTKEHLIFKIDYPSIEARTGGCVTGDKEIIIIFQEGKDMHIETAADFLHKDSKEVTDDERLKAKSANFGFLFGMGAKTYVEYAYSNYDLDISLEEANNTRNQYLKRYNGVYNFHMKNSKLLKDNYSFITNSLLGRKMIVDGFTNANNYPIQSSALDIIKLAATIFYNRCKEKKIDAVIINIVHDELVVKIKNNKHKIKAQNELKDSMEIAANYTMPLFKTVCAVQEL